MDNRMEERGVTVGEREAFVLRYGTGDHESARWIVERDMGAMTTYRKTRTNTNMAIEPYAWLSIRSINMCSIRRANMR